MSSLAADKISFGYADKAVLSDFSLDIASGGMVGIVGPNGAGKSTALKLFARLIEPQSGSIKLDGRDLRELTRRTIAQHIAFIPQQIGTQYPFTAGQVVLMARHPHKGLAPFETAQDVAIARRAMAECGIDNLADRPMPRLSGGEQQRVLVAAALAQQPKVLLADEPTSSLDLHYQVEIYGHLERLNREQGVTVLAVTHDLNLAAMFCKRIVVLAKGRIMADGTPQQVLEADLLQQAYGAEVLVNQRTDSDIPYVLPSKPGRQQ